MRHADGPRQIAERYAHFQEHNPREFRMVEGHTDEEVGWMAYWERIWNGALAFEIGWAVHPRFQDVDLHNAAVHAIDSARSEGVVRLLLACPSADNERTNAVCRQTGFTLLEQRDLEYEAGSFVACNVWSLDLS